MATPMITNQIYSGSEDRPYLHVPTFGFTGRSSLRLCAVLGIISSILYISAGASMLVHLQNPDKTNIRDDSNIEATKYSTSPYSDKIWSVLKSFSTTVIVVNVIQVISDALLFLMSLRPLKWKSLLVWGCCIVDRILFITTFLCSITIVKEAVPDEGLLLLLALLFGIVIRVYIMFVFRQAVNELRKAQGEPGSSYPCYPVILCFPI